MDGEASEILERDFARTLARGLAILELLAERSARLSVSQAARGAGVSRAAARRLLLTLKALGYVATDGSTFWLSPKVLTIGRGVLAANSVWGLIGEDVVALANRFNVPCSVSTLDGLDIIYVCRDSTRRIFTSRLSVGDRLPAWCCASGKLLLAALEPEEFRRRLRHGPPLGARTRRSLTDPGALIAEFADIRRRGLAVADGEMEDDIVSIAVPIHDRNGAVVAAMSLASHRGRCTVREMVRDMLPELRAAAAKATRSVATFEAWGSPVPAVGPPRAGFPPDRPGTEASAA